MRLIRLQIDDLGVISVALGAFGAHGLQKIITDPKSIKVHLHTSMNFD